MGLISFPRFGTGMTGEPTSNKADPRKLMSPTQKISKSVPLARRSFLVIIPGQSRSANLKLCRLYLTPSPNFGHQYG
jgi:hypothetical protein